jgi:Tol biopolymer transport system component
VPLDAGTRLGPYEIVSPLGQGGMGEVYRASDTRLDRPVAIKVLPGALAADAALRARFEREARAISALQHPNICALYDVGEAPAPDGPAIQFLVLEYLEGETLADRIARGGPLPAPDALRIAREICDALDKAHRSGIIHRDLKPANVFLARGGRSSSQPVAKLLDFGLAKSAAPVVATSGLSMLPTTPPTLTAQGTILGTFQYMAPEQIEGLDADARTDIFAFGALLFEMLTGRTAFEGKTRATLLGSILKDDAPSASALQPAVPDGIDRIIATCLAKDPEDRWQSARDVLHELQWLTSCAKVAPPPGPSRNMAAVRGRGWAILGLVALAAAAAGGAAATYLRSPAPPLVPTQFTVAAPPGATFATLPGGGSGVAPQIAISPDGRHVVFVANVERTYQLWLRTLDNIEPRPLAGTEGASYPFWSPDSRWIGFFAAGKMRKIALGGGPVLVVTDAAAGRGGTWNRENVIVFSPNAGGGLQKVPAAGGPASEATALDTEYGETSHRFPYFLPDGRHFLLAGTVGTCCPPTKAGRVRIGSLESTESTVLFEIESTAIYASGHLLFHREGMLMAQPFDARARRTTAEAFPVVTDIATEGSRYGSVAASRDGVLIYARGSERLVGQLTWFDRSGRPFTVVGEGPSMFLNIALAPEGRRIAAAATVGGGEPNREILVYENRQSTRLTFEAGSDNAPLWSNDGKHIVYASQRGPLNTLRLKAADGATPDESLLEVSRVEGSVIPGSWSADGRFLLYTQSVAAEGGQQNIWVLPFAGDRKPFPYLQTAASEIDPMFSPDQRWVAYTERTNAQSEVYVQPFPATGGKFQISRNGGVKPVWRRDGKELFYLEPDGRLVAVAVDASGTFRAGSAEPLFQVSTLPLGADGRQYAVSDDGKQFLVNVRPQQFFSTPLTVVVNWLEAARR